MELKKNIDDIMEDIKKYSPNPSKVQLIAATKYVDYSIIKELIDIEFFNFGENRVQALRDKKEKIDDERVKWHFIGHLQKNKIKYIIDYIDLIHSVDSLSLVKEIDKRAKAINKKQEILLEVNISGEESKGGFSPQEIIENIEELKKNENLMIKGLMTMAPLTDNKGEVKLVFKELRELKDKLNEEYFKGQLTELSMGMTNDYQIALEEGASLIRIGSKIFH